MNNGNDFVSAEDTHYRFKLGKQIASSLSGFIAGAIVVSIIWFVAYYLSNLH